MDTKLLVKISSRAWSLPILALMHGGVPGRQAALLTRTGAGRTAFAQSMENLIDLGLVERTPGHGHPLRPEYRLTPEGQPVAAMAERIIGSVPQPDYAALLRRSWTVPVLAVSQKPRFFTTIKTDLLKITDRALSQSLKQLEAHRWISREVDIRVHPPRPIYRAVNQGALIARAVQELAV